MSYIRLNIIDHERTVSGEVHGGVGDSVIASLSAEPESIHELELALTRFQKPVSDWSALASLRTGENFEPYDAGIMIIDLAAQVVMIDSSYSAPAWINNRHLGTETHSMQSYSQHGEQGDQIHFGADDGPLGSSSLDADAPTTFEARYHNGEHLTDVRLPYRLRDTWMFVGSVPEYKGICRQRRAARAARAAQERFDARAVLFGQQLSAFVATEILNATDLEAEDLITEIHAKWLITPVADLHNRSPREVLLAKMEFIDFDLWSREIQWSLTNECPAPLLTTSPAFRFAGFGTHEFVLYYDLVRMLLSESCRRASEEKDISSAEEIQRLEEIKTAWLETPNDDCQGKSPALVIEWERRRIPMAMSGKEAMVDPDCPVCRAMAADFNSPMFWHFDCSAMEDRFEFSDCRTLAEWQAERQRQEEFHREFSREFTARQGVGVPGGTEALGVEEERAH
jgi:hypothetical protein